MEKRCDKNMHSNKDVHLDGILKTCLTLACPSLLHEHLREETAEEKTILSLSFRPAMYLAP
jgi:hypothetical protein